MIYVITDVCVGMKHAACVPTCPVDCIYEGPDQFYINDAECIGCGLCEVQCPVSAIYAADAVPAHLQGAIEKNSSFFAA